MVVDVVAATFAPECPELPQAARANGADAQEGHDSAHVSSIDGEPERDDVYPIADAPKHPPDAGAFADGSVFS